MARLTSKGARLVLLLLAAAAIAGAQNIVPVGGLGAGPLAPIVFGIQIVSSIIKAIFGIGGNSDVKQLAKQVQQFENAASAAIDALKRFAWSIARALGALLQAFHDALVGLIHALWDEFKKLVSMLGKLITEGLAKLSQAVRTIRQVMRKLYTDYIRNVLNWIQKARRYLAILRALHVPFAGKLDGILARIEGRIIAPYLYVLRSLNGIGSWVNVILRADAVLQRAVFIRTMFAYQADWVNMWWGSQAGGGVAGGPPTLRGASAPATLPQVESDMRDYVTADAGPYAEVAARALAAAQAE